MDASEVSGALLGFSGSTLALARSAAIGATTAEADRMAPGRACEIRSFGIWTFSTLQDAAARDEEVEGDGAQDVPEGGLEVTRDFCFSMSEDTGPGD